MEEKRKLLEYMNKVEAYLFHMHGVEVEYGRSFEDCYFQGISKIEINSCQNMKSRLNSLLHEAGHVILRDPQTSPLCHSFKKSFPSMKRQGGHVRGNKKHRIDVMREEVMAWEYARNLAMCLDIELDDKLWAKHRYDSLVSYANWVV